MAYTYSKLEEALFGKGNKAFVGAESSPNNVRAIVIGGSFIFVVFHTKGSRLVQLDVNEVNKDLMKNGRNAGLHNVLSRFQLSCLEELYLDSVYKRGEFSGCFDLQKYISGLVNSKCRLRYYGYCQNEMDYWLKDRYDRVRSGQEFTYSLFNDKERVQSGMVIELAGQVNNPEWYKHYNLRGNDYALDKHNGTLDRYFSSIRNKIDKEVQGAIDNAKAQGFAACISGLYKQDLAMLDGMLQWKLLSKACKILTLEIQGAIHSAPEIAVTLRTHVFKKLYKDENRKFTLKVNAEEMKNILMESKCEKNDKLIGIYQQDFLTFKGSAPKLGGKDEKVLEMLSSRLESGEGITGFKSYYCKYMLELAEVLTGGKGYNKVIFVGAVRDMGLNELMGKQPVEVVKYIAERDDWLDLFNTLIMYMLGFNNVQSVMSYVKGQGGK